MSWVVPSALNGAARGRPWPTTATILWPPEMLERMPVTLWVTDRGLRFVYGGGARLTGTSLYDFVGSRDPDHPDIAAHLRALAGETVQWVIRHDRPLRACVAPYRDREGLVLGVAGVAVEAGGTDLARIQEALAESEERYRALFDRSCVAVATVDLDGRIRDANPLLCYLFGYHAHELRGRRADSLVAPGAILAATRSWRMVATGRRSRFQGGLTCARKDRRLFHARVTMSLIRQPEGAPALTVCMVEPLTDPAKAGADLPARLRLTSNEVAVLERIAAGRTNARVAAELHLSRQTVDYHLANLRRKLRAPSRSAVVARAYALGLLTPGQWPPTVSVSAVRT